MIVRRVGKHYVERAVAALEISEHIPLYKPKSSVSELLFHGPDKSSLGAGLLHSRDFGASARHEFPAYRPCTGKEIQYPFSREILDILHYVEYVLTGEIGSGTSGDVMRNIKPPFAIFSSDYPHSMLLSIIPQ